MALSKYEFEGLSSRTGFNRSLRHFKLVTEIVDGFESYRNLADILAELLDEKRLGPTQINPVVNALLVGHPKYTYISRSCNLRESRKDFSAVSKEVSRWLAVDILISYHHPDLGLTVINPKNERQWETVSELRKNELVIIYCGAFNQKANERLCVQAIDKLLQLLEGKKPQIPPALLQGKFKQRAPKAAVAAPPPRKARAPKRAAPARWTASQPAAPAAPAAPPAPQPAAAPPSAKRRMTPMYSIPVTNELFHNGNVEAWKKIIQSYNAKYPGLQVFIFYEGERINDINTLFKWGKVKHGSAIMIAVAGEDIRDLAKLQRYLKQGASPMFEAFLRFPVNTVLALF
jgi:hypothetical protein